MAQAVHVTPSELWASQLKELDSMENYRKEGARQRIVVDLSNINGGLKIVIHKKNNGELR